MVATGKKTSVLINGPLPPQTGGMETYCQDYLRTNLSAQYSISHCRAILIGSILKTRGPVRFALRCLNSLAITCVWMVMLVIKRPAIVHVHTNSYAGFYVKCGLTLLGRLVGAKTVLHMHGGGFKDFYRSKGRLSSWLIRRLICVNSAMIVLSEEWRQFFLSIGIPGEKLCVMTNAVFVPEAPNRAGNSEYVTVLFMSRFEKSKGIRELLDVIERKDDFLRRCRFVMAGPKTHDWTAVSERVAQTEMSGQVEMPGLLRGERKHRAYQDADIYLLQSYAEGMPIGLLEAMSYGLACITTSVGGIPDVIQDEDNGLLIPPGDSDALADTLEHLVKDDALRRRLGARGRETVEKRFDWNVRAEEISRFYQTLLQSDVPKREKRSDESIHAPLGG